MTTPHFYRFTLESASENKEVVTSITVNLDSDNYTMAQEQCHDLQKRLENSLGFTMIGTIRVLSKEGHRK